MQLGLFGHVPSSPTLKIHQMARELQTQGLDVCNLAAGDPVLPVHPAVIEGVERSLEEKFFPYPPVSGTSMLRLAWSEWFNQFFHGNYVEKETLITPGGKMAIYLALLALLRPGDETLIVAPYWVSYPEMIRLASAVPVAVHSSFSSHWQLPLREIQKALSPKVKVIILNNANNPTGALYPAEDIEALLTLAKRHDIAVICDEVYSHLVYETSSFVSAAHFPQYKNHVVVIQSASKNFAMTGWRIGAAFAPAEVIQAMSALLGQMTSGVPLAVQSGMLSVLKNAPAVMAFVHAALSENRELFYRNWNAHFPQAAPLAPSAIYHFESLSAFGWKGGSQAFCEEALAKAQIALVPGVAFGQEGFIRAAFTETPLLMQKGIESLSRWVRSNSWR